MVHEDMIRLFLIRHGNTMDEETKAGIMRIMIFALLGMRLHRSRKALIASDHLPIAADFRLGPQE